MPSQLAALRRELEATKDELADALLFIERSGLAFDRIRKVNRDKGRMVTKLALGLDKARDKRLEFEHRAYAAEAMARKYRKLVEDLLQAVEKK